MGHGQRRAGEDNLPLSRWVIAEGRGYILGNRYIANDTDFIRGLNFGNPLPPGPCIPRVQEHLVHSESRLLII